MRRKGQSLSSYSSTITDLADDDVMDVRSTHSYTLYHYITIITTIIIALH
jgi:hypothetical protein